MHPMQSIQPAGESRSLADFVAGAARTDAPAVRAVDGAPLSLATLFADPAHESAMQAVHEFLSGVGATIDLRAVPASLARGGTVGRIGVPGEAAAIMSQQRHVLGATFGDDPLAPVPRLWRGLQRRADVLLDMRQCLALPGSAAHRAGHERDVLLVSQRILERTIRPARVDAPSADRWTRARESAELIHRIAAAERRTVMLVLPVGRGTAAQQTFADALERQARVHRVPAPRVVKAGLLAALLCGEGDVSRWLVASVMPMDELSALATEAIGDTGPWPVVSIGRGASFYDVPASSDAGDPVPLLLAIVQLLQRSGRAGWARSLFDAVLVTRMAEVRMREELGTDLPVPTDAFLHGVLANWGRTPVPRAAHERVTVDVVRAPVGLVGEARRTSSHDAWKPDAAPAPHRSRRPRSALSA